MSSQINIITTQAANMGGTQPQILHLPQNVAIAQLGQGNQQARVATPTQGRVATPAQGRLATPTQGRVTTPTQARLATPIQRTRLAAPVQQARLTTSTQQPQKILFRHLGSPPAEEYREGQ